MSDKITPFTYINMINAGVDKPIEVDDKVYSQFIVNRSFSLHQDTIAIVNEVNKFGKITNQMHFDFLCNMIRPRRRFGKWPKPKMRDEAVTISKYLGVSMRQAYDMVGLFDEDELKQFERFLNIEE